MKNRLLVLTTSVVLSIPALCTAQRKGFVIGGSVAYGINQLATTFNYSLLAPYANKDGQYYGFELNAGYMLNNKIGIMSGIGMAWHSWITNTDNFDYYQYNCTTRYINLPVYIHVVTSKPGKVGAYTNTGFELGYLSGYTFLRDTGIHQQSIHEPFRKVAVAPFVNIGISVPLNGRICITAGPRVQYNWPGLFQNVEGNTQFAYSLQAGVLARL